MDGGALVRVRTEARTRVLTEMSEIHLHKNEVSGYAYNNANTLLTKIERVLKRQLFDESFNGLRRLGRDIRNALNEYKSTININKRDVLASSIAAANLVSTDDSTVDPEITNNSNAQEKADRQKVLRLASIGVKEGMVEGITNIVRKNITNSILRKTDASDFKWVDQYQIHQLFTAITEGAEIPEATKISRQSINITGKFSIGGRQS